MRALIVQSAGWVTRLCCSNWSSRFSCVASAAHFLFSEDGNVEKKEYGFVCPIDKVGRFVIPHNLREQYEMEKGKVLVIPREDGILLKPYRGSEK